MMLSAALPTFAQNNTRGYYKDIFMDSGILLYPDGVPYILEVK